MDSTTVQFLVQDAVVNGAVYALVATALVLVFAVTRVIFVPQGEYVAFSVLTLAALEGGHTPPTVWMLLGLGWLAAAVVSFRRRRQLGPVLVARIVAANIILPAVIALAVHLIAPLHLGAAVEIVLTLLIIVPIGPMLYDIAFEPLTEASVLVLLIAAFGVHISLTGLGLALFGPEGVSTTPLVDASYPVGDIVVTGQSLCVLALTLVLLAALAVFFRVTLIGKALRACSVNRLGARLVGMPTALAGRLAFGVAAFIGAISGILAGPLGTMYYDSGFLIGLKGFVAAIVGGLGSYVLTALAALLVGLAESFASFWASTYKEVLVFTLIIPFLVWRSVRTPHVEDDE